MQEKDSSFWHCLVNSTSVHVVATWQDKPHTASVSAPLEEVGIILANNPEMIVAATRLPTHPTDPSAKTKSNLPAG